MKYSEWMILNDALLTIGKACANMNCADCQIHKACQDGEICPVEKIAKLHAESEVEE